MEKGYFHQPETLSQSGEMNQNTENISLDEFVQRMPIPTEIPSPLNLKGLPLEIIRSNTVDALIQQNEDIMARLSVSLRRSSLLEDRLSQLEAVNRSLEHRNEILSDQYLVLQEKDKILSGRSLNVEKMIQAYKEKIQLLETQFAELYSDSKDKQDHLSSEIQKHLRRLSRLQKYKKNLRRVATHLRLQLRQATKAKAQLELSNQQIKMNITDLSHKFQQQSREAEENQKSLVNSYEDRLNEKQASLQQAQARIQELAAKAQHLDKQILENADLKNQVVNLQRKREEIQSKFEHENEQLQKGLVELRASLNQKVIETESVRRDLAETQDQRDQLKLENKKLIEQVESLQCLWQDGQTQLERQREKSEALQKLNQQLGSSLNQYRKDLQSLKLELDNKDFETKEKLKSIKGQMEVLNQAAFQASPENLKEGQEALGRIEDLMAEIQSGFNKKDKPSDLV